MRYVLLLIFALLLAACGAQPQGEAAPLATVAPQPSSTVAPTTVPPTSAPTSAPAAEPTTAPTGVAAAEPTAVSVPAAPLEELTPRLEPLLDGFDQPTHVTSAGDGSNRLFVTEQAGMIWIVRDGTRSEQPFLDLTDRVGSDGNEQGLLSVAFHPNYAENGRLFVNYTDRAGDTVVAEYQVSDDPDRVDPGSAKTLLSIAQPAGNHNGGLLLFGPDSYMYIGTGDGGRAGDPWGNGQSLDTLLGKILRIDVDNGDPYAIPADNPFVDRSDARPEIWAYGLRNPWRFAFDRASGDLFIADVGQNAFEEVHFEPAGDSGGRNYGWDTMEANVCFENANCDQSGLELPVAVYGHGSQDGGCSITGGEVYRGAAFPALAGTYLYADYCTGNLWGLRAVENEWRSVLLTTIDVNASSFGLDEAGEMYVTDRDGGGLYRVVL